MPMMALLPPGGLLGGYAADPGGVNGSWEEACTCVSTPSSSNEDLLRVLHKQILLLAPSHWLRTTHDSSVYPSVGGPMSG